MPHGIMIKDKKTGKYFGFVRQFPGICAQGDTPQEMHVKVHKFFKSFIDGMKDRDIAMDDNAMSVI